MPEDLFNWRKADLAYLEAVLQIIREYYDAYGRWPTAEELRTALKEH